MIGGGASGFIFKLIGQLVANQQGTVDAMIKKQSAADESHQKAATRGGEWVRRVIVCTVLFAVVVAPFILAHSPEGVTVGQETSSLLWSIQGNQVSDPQWLPYTTRGSSNSSSHCRILLRLLNH
jgi:hypothetical protein